MLLQRRLDSYVALVCSVVIVFISAFLYLKLDHRLDQADNTNISTTNLHFQDFGYFTSAEDFKSFLQESSSISDRNVTNFSGTGLALPAQSETGAVDVLKSTDAATRYSQTNVQVAGVDEPDIVKTNGQEIYISSENQYLKMEQPVMIEEDTAPDSSVSSQPYLPTSVTTPTRLISALPADKMVTAATLADTGQLLYSQNMLVVFSNDQKVTGYDVTNRSAPTQSWTYTIDGSYQTARLWQNKIYLIVNNTIDETTPCPIQPLSSDTKTITIPCERIYHPSANTTIDTTYSVIKIDPITGQVDQSLSFVGGDSVTSVYISTNAIYLAYPNEVDYATYSYTSIIDSALDLFPKDVQDKIIRLNGYDISFNAKYLELQSILEKYYAGLSAEAQLRQQTDVENRVKDYYQSHRDALDRTSLTKVSLTDLTVAATGDIPGRPLNQFSFDEYQGNLRVATTSASNGWFSSRNSGETTNDIYVLDGQLNQIGQLRDLGLGETIYSARFVGDRGYLVTFRQTDPFFVLDLSNPRQPELKGELKIPGYSSYLHPLTDTQILGIGSENGQVKLSLFDVTDANNPIELANQKLDDYWSDAQNNHHAFLQDSQHKVFFMPGSQNGFIFSYDNNTLTLTKKIESLTMKRAVYLNDNLYVIGDTGVVAFDETTWNQVGELLYPTVLP